jgi:hypothetical protein
MAEGQSQTNDSTKQIMQQGYRTALFELRGSIEDYISGNEAARPTILADIKRHLLDADKGSVQKLFTGANALKGAADETFSLSGADAPEEIRGLSIPKRLFTEDFKAKTFLPEYDRINVEKLQLAAETEASVKAEGAATKLDAAKQALFGKGLGAIGTALGIKAKGKAETAGAGPAAPAAETKEEKSEKRLAEVKARGEERAGAEKARREKEKEEQEKKSQAAEEAVQKIRKVEDSALYHKRFIDILSSLGVDPEPFANNGAAYTGIADLERQVKLADKTLPQPELKELVKRLDELGTEYKAGQLEHGRGEDGLPRLRSAVKAVRDKLGVSEPSATATLRGVAPPALSPALPARLGTLRGVAPAAVAPTTGKTLKGVAPAPTEPSARKTIRGVAPPAAAPATPSAPETKDKALNSLLSKSDSLVKKADDIRRALDQTPDDEKLLQQKTAVAAEISKLSGQIQDHAAKNEPGNKNLIQLGAALSLAGAWHDDNQVLDALHDYGKNRSGAGAQDQTRINATLQNTDYLFYRINDLRVQSAQGKHDPKEQKELAREVAQVYDEIKQQTRLYDPENRQLDSLKAALLDVSIPLKSPRFDNQQLTEVISRYGRQRPGMGPAVSYDDFTQRSDELVSNIQGLNSRLTAGQETPELLAQRQQLAFQADRLYDDISEHILLFDPNHKELNDTRFAIQRMSASLGAPSFGNQDQQRLTKAIKSYGEIPRVSLPANLVGMAAATVGGGATATGATEVSTNISLEADAKQAFTMEAPVIPPPPSAIDRTGQPQAAEIQVEGRLPTPVSIPLPPPPAPPGEAGQAGPMPSAALTGMGLMAAAAKIAPSGEAGAPSGSESGVTTTAAQTPEQVMVSRPQAGKTLKVALPQAPSQAQQAEVTKTRPAAAKTGLPQETTEGAPKPPPTQATAPQAAAQPSPAPPAAGMPPPGQAPTAKPVSKRAQTGVPGMGTFVTAGGAAAGPAKSSLDVGPIKIKPPMGRGLETSRAMALGAAQGAARRQAEGQDEYWEDLAQGEGSQLPEGLDLSYGGMEEAMGGAAGGGPSLPVQFGQFYDPMAARRTMATPQYLGPGSMATEPTAGEEDEQGGTRRSDFEQAADFSAQQQRSSLAAEQLTGAPTTPQAGAGRPGAAARPSARTAGSGAAAGRPSGQPGKGQEMGMALKLLSAQVQHKMQQDQRTSQINEFKAKIESLQRAKQTFKNLIDLGEILASESGVTILTLWLEWNVDLINKRVANGSLPWFEKKPPENATSLEKITSWTKDGITILADILIPLGIMMSVFFTILIPAVLMTTILGIASVLVSYVTGS